MDRAEAGDARGRGAAAAVAVLQLAVAALAVRCIAAVYSILPIAAPFQADYEEGNILNALTLILGGRTPWPDPRVLPSVMDPYGPVAYYLLVVPVRLFGVRLVYPRAMILGCVLIVAALLAAELARRTRSWLLAASFALIYLTIPNVQEWGWLLRVDFLGIAFTAAGFCVFSRRLARGDAPGALPALLFAAALLVKTTLVAAPAACLAVLLARRRVRDAVRLAGLTAAAVVGVVVLFAVITRGAFVTDVFLSHPDPYSRRRFLGGLLLMIWDSWPLVALAAVAVLDDVAKARLSPPVAWLLSATAATFTSGALGSNRNHFLEWNTALCLAAGIGMARLVLLRPPVLRLASLGAAAAALALVLVAPREIAFAQGQEGCAQAYEWVRTQAGPNLLAENVGALVLGGKRVWMSNPFNWTQMVEHAGWSDAELLRMVRERRFDAVIVRPAHMTGGYRRFPRSVLQAIGDEYEAHPGFECLDMQAIYTPRR
jgi:4-amino-4-deoxy-L-arabinose transferase-like glycosyltransferase